MPPTTGLKWQVRELAALCNSSTVLADNNTVSGCAGFTTWGDIKGATLEPYAQWQALDPNPLSWNDPKVVANCSGTYVRLPDAQPMTLPDGPRRNVSQGLCIKLCMRAEGLYMGRVNR